MSNTASILTDEKGNIIAYSTVGGIEGGVRADLPDDFLEDEVDHYKYLNGKLFFIPSDTLLLARGQ